MTFKTTKLYSISTGCCPQCHQESMYKTPNPYSLQVLEMHEKCSHCGLKYNLEPSFFYGAMYVSYALTIAIGMLFYLVAYFGLGISLIWCFVGLGFVYLLLTPFVLRWSRNIWINVFKHYNPNWKQQLSKSPISDTSHLSD